MRVLFTTWAWPAHYFPMVPMAWAVRAAGHDVRMTSQPSLLPTMRASALPSTPVGRDVDVATVFRTTRAQVRPAESELRPDPDRPSPRRSNRYSDRMAARVDSPDLELGYRALRELEDEAILMFQAFLAERAKTKASTLSLYGDVAEAMVDDLLAFAKTWRPDLIVFDALTYAGPIVAKLLGIPAVRSLFGPDVTYFTSTIGLAELLDKYGLEDLDLLGVSSVDSCPPGLQLPHDIAPTRRLHTQYVPYNGLAEIPAWIPDQPKRPRIVLTWGTSMEGRIGEQGFLPGELLLGCTKLADERDAELILAITASQVPLLPRDLPPYVRVVESVPLNALLPTCTAVVHQGGAGTMQHALRHGVPQLVLTQLFDQAANAFQLVAAGAGKTLPVAGLEASDLLAAGHALLDDPAYRAGAQRLQHQMLDQPTPAEVVDDLLALA